MHTLWARKMGRDPDNVDSQIAEIVKLMDYSIEVPNSIIVRVLETCWVYLIGYDASQ